MSKERASLSSKTYKFTYPSVAVWHDFDKLTLKNSRKKQNAVKNIPEVNSVKSALSRGAPGETPGNMKRKKNSSKFVGTFIHPTQFQLEHSVLLPSSRAGIRLKPIKNAPIPPKDEKSDSSLPSVAERPKFSVEDRATTFLEERVQETPHPSMLWDPNEIREHTELAKEPSLFLDINYGSDGDLDIIEIPDSKQQKKERRKRLSHDVGSPEAKGTLPDLAQQVPQVTNSEASIDVNSCESTGRQSENGTLPRISSPCKVNSGVGYIACSNVMNSTEDKALNAEVLPVLKAKRPGKTAARYALKNRHQPTSTRATRLENKDRYKSTAREFIVGGGKQVAAKRGNYWDHNPKVKANQSKGYFFTKRKQAPTPKKDKQAKIKTPVETQQLPAIGDPESMAGCEVIDHMSLVDENEQLPDIAKREERQEEHLSTSTNLSLPGIKGTPLDDFPMEIEPTRVCSPRVLEFPIHKMKKYHKTLFEEKKAAFRKLDIDDDGHLSLLELMKCFPEELSKHQVEYLKVIYLNACSSTFFGLEEYLCVEEMCNVMKVMSEELRAVFSRIHLRELQAILNDYLFVYSKAYDKTLEGAIFDKFLERAITHQGHSNLTELLRLLPSLEEMNFSQLQCNTMLISLAILLGLSSLTTAEKKGKGAMKLCGSEFFLTYKVFCAGGARFKRSILELPRRIRKDNSKFIPVEKDKTTNSPFLKERVAKRFLRRVQRTWRSLRDNATEECCNETCTYEEVREYPCAST